MPKRVHKIYLENSAKVRRKSALTDDRLQQQSNSDESHSSSTPDTSIDKGKPMVRRKCDFNSEVERLLMNNSKELLYHIDHSDFPAFNLGVWGQENYEMLSTYPSCAFSVPQPIFVADKHCEKIDLCYKRPIHRSNFKMRMKFTRTCYKSALKSNKNIRSCAKDQIYHKSVFDIAERLYSESDPYFRSSYDNYFTGGNLCVLPYQGIVLHAGGEKLQEIVASKFTGGKEVLRTNYLEHVASMQQNEKSEIFECHPLLTSQSNSEQNFYIARQRNVVTLNELDDNSKITTVTQFRTKSTPFISFAQSKHAINNFILTTMKQHVRLYDLNSNMPRLAKIFQVPSNLGADSWNTVKPWRENTFLYVNEKEFFVIDIRTSPEQWLKENSLTNGDLICDHYSALLPSGFNNLFYVATNHKLQCMDIRYIKKNSFSSSKGGICRWSHQLRYAPLMLDTFRVRQTEYIALSSPIAGDLHICQLSRKSNENNTCSESPLSTQKHFYTSPCLPYQPPTLLEAYDNARLSGKCLKPESNMAARIKCCTTGMKFFKAYTSNSDYAGRYLLTSNSNGDVFAQTLCKREDNESEKRCNKGSDDIMAEFESKICKLIKPPLNYTEIKNMKGMRKVFLCKQLSLAKKCSANEMEEDCNDPVPAVNGATGTQAPQFRKHLHLGRWQKSLSTLQSYKDALVSDLLSIWDIDVEEDEVKLQLRNLQNNKSDPALKVENWLKANVDPNAPNISMIPSEEISSYNINDTSCIFNSTPNINQSQNIDDFENAIKISDVCLNTSENANTSGATSYLPNNTKAASNKIMHSKTPKKYIKGF